VEYSDCGGHPEDGMLNLVRGVKIALDRQRFMSIQSLSTPDADIMEAFNKYRHGLYYTVK
jgi:hypothetical protein